MVDVETLMPGMKVRIKPKLATWDEDYTRHGLNQTMRALAGEIVTVAYVDTSDCSIKIEEDDGRWTYEAEYLDSAEQLASVPLLQYLMEE